MPSASANSHPTFETGITYNTQPGGSTLAGTPQSRWNQDRNSGPQFVPRSGSGSIDPTALYQNPGFTAPPAGVGDVAANLSNIQDSGGHSHMPNATYNTQYEPIPNDASFAAANALSPQTQEMLNDFFSQTAEQQTSMVQGWGLAENFITNPSASSSQSGGHGLPIEQDSQTLRYSNSAVHHMTEGIDRLRTTVSPTEMSYAAQEASSSPSIPQVFSNSTQPATSSNSPLGVGVLPGPAETRLVGGWHDSTDLPTAMRDKLLGHFFKEAKKYFLGVDRPRFQTRLTLEPRKRPHPCWMYAMVSIERQATEGVFLTCVTIVLARRNVFSGTEFA
jgi:hypothetical protein